MASTIDYISYVCDNIKMIGAIRYKKMFGEYMIYCDGRAVLLVCDDTVFVKQIPAVAKKFTDHGVTPTAGFPYRGAKEHWILDIEDTDFATDMTRMLAIVLPLPKPKKPKVKK